MDRKELKNIQGGDRLISP
ncbi:hypothetical protein [Chryseobacterium sp. LC2016-29]